MTRQTPRSLLDSRLAAALRPLADEAPMPADLLDVPDAWLKNPGRSDRRPWVIPVVAAAVIVTLLVVGALGGVLLAPRVGDGDDAVVPVDRLDLDPRVLETPAILGIRSEGATGPVIQVVRGNAASFAFVGAAFRTADGICLEFRWLHGESGGCGSLPQDDLGGGIGLGMTLGVAPSDTAPGFAFGLASPEAHAVRVGPGGSVPADLVDLGLAGIDAQAFLVFLPAGTSSTIAEAYDMDGELIGRIDTASWEHMHEAPDGVPTPASGVDEHPQLRVVLRNHTERGVDSTVHEESATTAGSVGGTTPPCDVDSSGIAAYEGKTWWIEVEGREILRADASTPTVGSGQVLEILIDVRPGEEPVVTSTELLPIEASTAGPALGREPRPWWSQRWWDVAADLECTRG